MGTVSILVQNDTGNCEEFSINFLQIQCFFWLDRIEKYTLNHRGHRDIREHIERFNLCVLPSPPRIV